MTKSSQRSSGGAGSSDTSHSPSGSARVGRRRQDRVVAPEPPFLERHRNTILGIALVAGIAIVGGFVFLSATSPSYACSTQFGATPTSPERLGALQEDMGSAHVGVGDPARYTYCPPASGAHVNQAGQGPILARYYGPDDAVVPQGWIHNLEHGSLVVLYRCEGGGCDQASQDALRGLFDDFPPSPVCDVPRGRIGPVIARFDQMSKPYAALVWGRVLYQDTLDTDEILRFYEEEGERGNPEPQCAGPSPSPSPSPAPSTSPEAS